MVVFGGSQVPDVRVNDGIYFDFLEVTWKVPRIAGNKKPSPRYGHAQVLDGCWLLTVGENEWSWEPVKIDNTEYTGQQFLWCHSACKVSNMIVTLHKPAKQPEKPSKTSTSESSANSNSNSRIWVPPTENVNNQSTFSANNGACNTVSEKTNKTEQASHNSESSSATNEESGACNDINDINQSEINMKSHDQLNNHSESGMQSLDQLDNQSDCSMKSQDQLDNQSEVAMKSHDQLDNQSYLENPVAGTSNPRPGLPSVRPNAMNNRQKQLEAF